ncbi:hypothetical protein GCM10009621_18410 [Corynebacterium felinum]
MQALACLEKVAFGDVGIENIFVFYVIALLGASRHELVQVPSAFEVECEENLIYIRRLKYSTGT